jgi:CO/xanthine dehydrogenase FAD-binding subunit
LSVLHRPKTLNAALALRAQNAGRLLAGGTDVFPALVDRPPPATFIDLSRVDELRAIARNENEWRIGAGARWSDIANAQLPPAFRMLQMAAREIGSLQIQNRATIGGNLCNASPAADSVPCLLALDAQVELASAKGARRLPLDAFILGNRKIALGDDEILSAVLIPSAGENDLSSFFKLGARRYLVISIVMAAAALRCDAQGRITQARLAIGAASAVAQRLPALERRLVGLNAQADLAQGDLAPLLTPDGFAALAPIDDVRASAIYRREAAPRALAHALQDAAARQGARV